MEEWKNVALASELLIARHRRKTVPFIILSGKNSDGVKLILDEFMSQGASFMSIREAAAKKPKPDHFIAVVRGAVGIFLDGVTGTRCLMCGDMRPTGEWIDACADTRRACVMVSYGDSDSVRRAAEDDFSSVLALSMGVRFS